MSRLKVNIPENAVFLAKVKIPILISHINYGNHLGHDSLISILHEARLRFLKRSGFSDETKISADIGYMIASLAVTYVSEAVYGDMLEVEIFSSDLTRKTCDFNYKVTKLGGGTERIIATAATCLSFVDYRLKKLADIPDVFLKILNKEIKNDNLCMANCAHDN